MSPKATVSRILTSPWLCFFIPEGTRRLKPWPGWELAIAHACYAVVFAAVNTVDNRVHPLAPEDPRDLPTCDL